MGSSHKLLKALFWTLFLKWEQKQKCRIWVYMTVCRKATHLTKIPALNKKYIAYVLFWLLPLHTIIIVKTKLKLWLAVLRFIWIISDVESLRSTASQTSESRMTLVPDYWAVFSLCRSACERVELLIRNQSLVWEENMGDFSFFLVFSQGMSDSNHSKAAGKSIPPLYCILHSSSTHCIPCSRTFSFVKHF